MRFLDVRGTRVRVHETGDPAAPPVVLLHGIGRSLEDWSLQHPLLDGDYRVISIDMPGFGLSQRLAAPTTLAGLADGVWATLDTLGETRPVHLMGNSLGGAVAMTMLAGTPERVSTLTLVNSAGFGKEVTVALRLLAVPVLGRQMLRRVDRLTAPRMERMVFADRAHVTPERIEMAIRIARQPDFAAVYLEVAKALGGLRGVAAAWRTELLGRLRAHEKPTMLVWGDRDLILPSKHLAAARAAFPHAQSHLFAHTGHMPQIERPEEFAGLVRPMLATVSV
ncbi:alpha/beta fold hydrolase [Actinoplanes utahensis]|uniref:Hydrolase n=1 Tax=Actinoplanes utahensis TaxID=1869 RepID=A0A0A6UUZ2_ACTUT|nr:alpha/beta fold hydrolase [Actinoplanes utahensis]KHD78753.1 hydrolase [Actinoplanes utahensis]GIF32115.1 alpha/beta hydrolase [Actinoplanes utahensis]